MMKPQWLFVLSLAYALAGCGGGGGGSSNENDNTGDPGSGSGGSTPVDSTSTAQIVFPWKSATATSQTITVGGTATDAEGVARVTVNGVDAMITTTASASGTLSKTLPSAKTLLSEHQVTWSAQVTLENGDNMLAVSVVDSTGVVTADLDSATIRYIEVPITFTLDPDGTRVVGLSYTLTPSGFVQNLVQHDYATLEQTIFGSVQGVPANTCFRRFENEFLYLQYLTDSYDVRKYDLTTGQDSVVAEILSTTLDGGIDFQVGSVRELVCGGTHTSAYALVNHIAVGGGTYAKSRILEIDLSTSNVTTLSESDVNASPLWIANYIALAEDRIVSMRDLNSTAPLTSVSLADGTRSDLTPGLNVGGMALHPDLASDRVYIATFPGIDEINLATLGKQNISPVDSDDPLAFAQIRAIGLDAANNRVVVGDSDLDTLIAVDITTGERSVFLSRNTGTGIPLVVPRSFAITADASRAYVIDDGGNVAERLFEIDLTTGDRRVVGDINQPFNYTATGLALDETGNRVFLSFSHIILEVDLETELVRTVAAVDSSALMSIRGLLLDSANNRLLIGDPGNDGIYALDLTTLAVEVISQEGAKGSGPAFGTVISLTGPTSANELYVAGQATETVTRVDLATGDREAIIAECNTGGSSDLPDLQQVLLNEAANELLILGASVYSFDLATTDCARLPRSIFPLEIQNASANQLLAVTFGALLQIDRETGEIVLVSK